MFYFCIHTFTSIVSLSLKAYSFNVKPVNLLTSVGIQCAFHCLNIFPFKGVGNLATFHKSDHEKNLLFQRLTFHKHISLLNYFINGLDEHGNYMIFYSLIRFGDRTISLCMTKKIKWTINCITSKYPAEFYNV